MAQLITISGATESVPVIEKHEDSEPPQKKTKLETTFPEKDRLESRLVSVLSCVVCFDLPRGPIYQCQHGHLMCIGCFNHLLADGRLKNEQASCPSCRTEISSKHASRNLAVEKAVSELPSHCRYCKEEYPRNQLPGHENDKCDQRYCGSSDNVSCFEAILNMRPAACRYKNIGCLWEGMWHQCEAHEKVCLYPQKAGSELLEGVSVLASEASEEIKRLNGLFKMLSYEKIAICDVQLCPNRSDDYIPKLYYETNRFSAFDQLWCMKAKVIGNEASANRSLTYQLILKGKGAYEVKYFLLKGPFGDARIQAEVQRFEFRDDNKESEYHTLLLDGDGECNRLLAARTVNVRLMMFLVKK